MSSTAYSKTIAFCFNPVLTYGLTGGSVLSFYFRKNLSIPCKIGYTNTL